MKMTQSLTKADRAEFAKGLKTVLAAKAQMKWDIFLQAAAATIALVLAQQGNAQLAKGILQEIQVGILTLGLTGTNEEMLLESVDKWVAEGNTTHVLDVGDLPDDEGGLN